MKEWPPEDGTDFFYSDRFDRLVERVLVSLLRKYRQHEQVVRDIVFNLGTNIYLECQTDGEEAALRSFRNFKSEKKYSAYLKQKCDWLILDVLKTTSLRLQSSSELSELESILSGQTNSPVEYAIAQEVIESLPNELQKVLEEYLVSENTTEVAKKLDISTRTVERRLKAIKDVFANIYE